ncbi:alpha/beta fold hydrolase [Azospirillum doebereinerae]
MTTPKAVCRPCRRRALVGALALAAGVAVSGTAHAQSRSTGATRMDIRNVVLVHGAFTDGNVWSDVILRLQAKGFTVSAAQNPLTSLAADVAATKRVLDRQDGPTVLVGHSWGGAVIGEAGASPNVRALVYVSALAPDVGEAVTDLQKHGPEAPGMRGAHPDAAGMIWFAPASYGPGLAADIAPERVGVLAATQQPIVMAAFNETLKAAAWRDKPSWYLLSTDDQALAPELQRFMATRMKARITEVASSHMSPISQADAVVSLIEAAASD